MGDSLSDKIQAELDSGMLNNLPAPPLDPTKTTWSVAELLSVDTTDLRMIIPNVWPAGLTFFGGRPKLGKSWFMQQVSYTVGIGGRMFDYPVERGKVLYLALEDSVRRLKKRIEAMGIPPECDITYQLRWPPLQGKGIDLLATEIERHGYLLVVIDTLSRAIPGIDQDKAEVVGPIIARLQELTKLHNNGITLVDHTRKPSGFAADPVDDLMSSTAKAATADTVFALYREQGKAGARLLGRSREIEEVDLRIIWDRNTCAWQSQGDTGEMEMTEHRANILAALEELGGKAQATTIARAVKQDLSNTVKRLNELVNADFVYIDTVEGKKYYCKNI
ncbi:MAG: AAA family ATPase [Chloroflexi bacterium]|nr:MAG: AAA family ATPase [Chloroflexota bacterium]